MPYRAPLSVFLSVACAMLFSTIPVWADDVDTGDVFELDGNPQDLPTPLGEDWSTVNPGGSGGTPIYKVFEADFGGSDRVFTTGNSKDLGAISGWRHKVGSVPDKDNITNAYAAAYLVGDDIHIYFGADRYANDGSAQLGFWFFRNPVQMESDGTFSGAHVDGDLLILANFDGNGDVSIEVLEWDAGTLISVGGKTGSCGPGCWACAISNPSTTIASPWSYTPKAGVADEFPTLSFFEGGVSLKSLYGEGELPCFSSFLAETRSSTSVNSTLKDFVLAEDFGDNCSVAITKTCGTATYASGNLQYAYSGQVTAGMSNLIDVVVTDDAGTPSVPGDDQSFSLGSIAAGNSAPYSGTLTTPLTMNGFLNTAKVTAYDGLTGTVELTDTASDQCEQLVLSPLMSTSIGCRQGDPAVTVEVNNCGGTDKVVLRAHYAGTVCNTSIDATVLTITQVMFDPGTPAATADDINVTSTLDKTVIGPSECATFSANYYPKTVTGPNPSTAAFAGTARATAHTQFGLTHIVGPVSSSQVSCSLCACGP